MKSAMADGVNHLCPTIGSDVGQVMRYAEIAADMLKYEGTAACGMRMARAGIAENALTNEKP